MTAVLSARMDEHAFGAALDRWSPGLLGLAMAFAADAGTAHRMVEHGWLGALRQGQPDGRAGSVRLAVVRAMTEPAAGERDPALLAGRRALRLAVRAGGVLVLPDQRDRRRRRAPGAPALPDALEVTDLRRLPPPLRLVLLLSDVQRWPAAEVEALLEVRPEVHRAVLGHARECLASAIPLRSA
jgi:hypothetical protein